jgi:hypothetical protein
MIGSKVRGILRMLKSESATKAFSESRMLELSINTNVAKVA